MRMWFCKNVAAEIFESNARLVGTGFDGFAGHLPNQNKIGLCGIDFQLQKLFEFFVKRFSALYGLCGIGMDDVRVERTTSAAACDNVLRL